MGRFSSLAGRRVEAHYRAGDITLSAVGTLVAETENSVFLEEHFVHNRREKTIRSEIPLDYLIRILEMKASPAESADAPAPPPANPAGVTPSR